MGRHALTQGGTARRKISSDTPNGTERGGKGTRFSGWDRLIPKGVPHEDFLSIVLYDESMVACS